MLVAAAGLPIGAAQGAHKSAQCLAKLTRLAVQGSEYMSPDEIESILRLQWKSLQGQSPYHEDYYFQVRLQHACASAWCAGRHKCKL